MKRWTLKPLGLILLSSLLLLGYLNWIAEALAKSKNAEKIARVILVLVDMSGSTNRARHTVFREAFDKIYQGLGQGDRIIAGTITGRSYIDFKPVVDEEIPKKTIWVNRIQFEHNLTTTKERILREVDRLLSRKRGTQRTEILNSLNIADTIFHEEKRQKILVVLSDMIQDSKEYNFAKDKLTSTYIDKAIRHRRQHNLIPNLTGVKVYVAGASAADPERFRWVEKFWARYFGQSGADFSRHRYGHSLLSFETGS